MRKHNEKPTRKCDRCKRDIREDRYEAHLATHLNDNNECEICNKQFSSAANLTAHMLTHAEEKPYKCDKCGKSFVRNDALLKHALKHKPGANEIACEECGKSFDGDEVMKEHILSHGRIRLHKCEKCGESVSGRHKFQRHKILHRKNDLHECKVCGKRFPIGTLNQHMKVHGAERYSCEQCGRVFNNKGNLRAHMFVHAEDKPYKCDLCFMSFIRKDALEKHAVKCERTDDNEK